MLGIGEGSIVVAGLGHSEGQEIALENLLASAMTSRRMKSSSMYTAIWVRKSQVKLSQRSQMSACVNLIITFFRLLQISMSLAGDIG